MRRIFHLTLLCLVGGVVSACQSDLVVATENIPTAGVRFINAVPDTGGAFGMDLRFVDIFESNAHFRITYRNGPSAGSPFVSTQTQFKGARAGARKFRIFFDDTLQTIAQFVVKDTTVTLTEAHNYTAILMGNSRSAGVDKMQLKFFDETVPDPVLQVAIRVINATASPIDVRQYGVGGLAAALAAAPTWAAVPAYSVSTYALVAPDTIRYNVQPAGGGANLFADAVALPGFVASCSNLLCVGTEKPDIPALPGTKIAGSAVTAIVFPPSAALARTPQAAAFLVPAITFMWDRRPPKGCDPKIC